jgi:hypothetical protein
MSRCQTVAVTSRINNRTARTGPPWQSARARGDLPVADEVGELVQDEPGIRDRPRIPGMTGKR